MTYVRVKCFKIFKDRHGKTRCYHRASSTAIDLDRFPFGSLLFLAECERIRSLGEKSEAAKPGTLGLLIEKYRAHPAFTDLQPRTRSDYQKCFDYLQSIEDTPLTKFTSSLVVRRQASPGSASLVPI
jgi:hypothetical protein